MSKWQNVPPRVQNRCSRGAGDGIVCQSDSFQIHEYYLGYVSSKEDGKDWAWKKQVKKDDWKRK